MSGLFFAGSGKVQQSVVEQTVFPLTSVFSPPAENLSAPMSFPYESPRNCATTVTVSPALIRTLVVDDEPIARQVLRDELGAFGDVQIAGEAANGNEALREIVRLKPDLVFLDLQMPGMGGFDVIRSLPDDAMPIVVIVTAYDEHAIRAFEAGALDYLLKPVSRERLEKALDRARALRGKTREVAESLVHLSEGVETPSAGRGRKVVGRTGSEYYLLDLDDVLAFQAEREIVWILTAKQRYMATQTLRNVDERLRGSVFQRVHRNALVNVNHVRKMSPLSSQRWLLTLSNGQEFIVSKRQASAVRRMLQW
jgi:two-component system, LytTR family, response regulator